MLFYMFKTKMKTIFFYQYEALLVLSPSAVDR